MKPPVPYARFCAERTQRWDAHADCLERVRDSRGSTFHDVERLVELQNAVASDLSAARTWFPASAVVARLTRQALDGARALQPPPPPVHHRIWTALLAWPRLVRATLRGQTVSTATFVAGVVVGSILAARSDTAALAFVGEDALQAASEGELWTDAIAASAPPALLALYIGLNNAAVGLLAWASGLLLGTGSLYIVLTNGLMVGTLFSMAHRYGVLNRMFAFTAAHGPLELTLIIVCGGAGLSMARGMLDDDGRTVGARLADAASRSLHVVLGTLPGFFLLGWVEGFISPNMDVPTAAKAILGAALWAVFGLVVAVAGRSTGPAEARPGPSA